MEEMDTNIACFRIGNTHVIPVTDPKIAREFLVKQDATFASRPVSMAARAFSGGYVTTIFSTHGEQWKKMRRVVKSEIICPVRYKWLHDKRAEEAANLMKHVFNQCQSLGQVNLRQTTRHYCGRLIIKK
ncbi:tryptophan N-monooxygenase 2-like [Syzygium oleosum]|uniref:tryptophan N-monooxygenase 2-like n=1 Tax=Syzygium oleosum TaxID=219896 RepID=UPI0024BAA4C3|nr:tryptophan N-monooxygenase 2-like [Syzygium oleosum]